MIADTTRAIELAPERADALGLRGYARLGLGDVRGAVADFERFLVLAPDGPVAADVRARLPELRARVP